MATRRYPSHVPAPRLVVPAVFEPPPADLPDLDAYKAWRPEAQARALELLRERQSTTWRPFYCPDPVCDGHPHAGWEHEHARADQRPPTWVANWLTWFLSGGRGSGKTRTGSEVTHAATGYTPRITLVAPTGPDFRETMVEGMSGLLATSPPGKRPLWEPSKKKLTWPNGCIALGFSAEEPDRLRGPQAGFVWADEPCHYPVAEQVWDNIKFGLRVKGRAKAKIIATSTPKSTKFVRTLIEEPRTVTTRVSTYENLINLDDEFRDAILEKYEGTRIGRQELHGELLDDVEGALWSWEMFSYVEEPPQMDRIVVGVDPAGTANPKSDETGIVVVGIAGKNLYVLADYSGKYSPAGWANKANSAYEDFSADAIVPEKNYGGDMVKHTLESSGYKGARIIMVDSRRGKALRAEPIVALYEKGHVYHTGKRGDLAVMEDEQTSWVPGKGDSPNRVDALVHACTELAKRIMPAQIANPNRLHVRAPDARHLHAV